MRKDAKHAIVINLLRCSRFLLFLSAETSSHPSDANPADLHPDTSMIVMTPACRGIVMLLIVTAIDGVSEVNRRGRMTTAVPEFCVPSM